MKRRTFLSLLGAGAVAACGGSGLVYAAGIEPYAVELVEKRLALPGLGPGLQGMRAAQISDMHMGGWMGRAYFERCAALLMAQKPDVIFLTGDFVTAGGNLQRALDDLDAAFSPLASQAPVFAILGNHDHGRTTAGKLSALFGRLGIQELPNTILPFQRGGDTLYIAGIDSVSSGDQRLDLVDQAAPTDAPVILLAHEPDMADFSALTKKFVLQLSGHSHGGQIILPGVGSLVLPWMGQKYPSGWYSVDGMQLYTNRGLGMIHVPLRVNCPPEITLFTFVTA